MVIDVYAAMEDGVWLYEPKTHTLQPLRLRVDSFCAVYGAEERAERAGSLAVLQCA